MAQSAAQPAAATPPVAAAPAGLHPGRLVARNMLALVFSQLLTTPISIVVNAVLARSLGASDFGTIYLATTVLTVGFLLVDWGGQAQVAAEVARNRKDAAAIFGTGLLLRVCFGAVLLLLVPPFARLMGYDQTLRTALLLVGIRFAFASLSNLCSAMLRGFERLQWHARAAVFAGALEAALVIPTLLMGGRLQAALTAQAVTAGLALLVQLALVRKLQIGLPRVRRSLASVLLGGGFGFLVLEIVLKLQPYIDAAFLSRLAPPEVLGWYGAASRMVGVLIFPATTLSYALYPTLVRLWAEDKATYASMVRLGVRTVVVLGTFTATATLLFSDLIVSVAYGTERFAPAAGNLGILAGYLLLVYVSIVLSVGIAAAGRQLRWALAQSICLLVSVALDPLLIPVFQARYGNGSLGVCVSVVLAEVIMVMAGARLLPAGTLPASLLRTVARCLCAAAAMATAGLLLRRLWPLALPVMAATYFGMLWRLRELDAELLAHARSILSRKVDERRTPGQEPGS